MRIEQFKYLIEIGHCSSISEAGERLCISHQAISSAIKALEDELGVQLVQRGYKGTVLTAQGKYVVKASLEFFQKLERVSALGEESELRGSLSLFCTHFAAEVFLPSVMVAYYNRYPHVTVHNQCLVPEQVVRAFAEGRGDLAFLSLLLKDTPALTERMGLTFEPCTEIRTYIEVSRHSALAQYKSISLNLLKSCPVIYNCSAETAEAQRNNWPFRYIHGKRTRYEASRRVYRELLASDYGAGIIGVRSDMPLERDNSDIVVIPVRDVPAYYFGYLVRREPFGLLAKAFLRLL